MVKERFNMLQVDLDRVNIINDMNQEQKDAYLLGMCFHSAFYTAVEIKNNKPQVASDIKELKTVYDILIKNKMSCELTNMYESLLTDGKIK
jgi:hypothetical protein